MVIVPTAGGGSYCIDRTEVTYKQYLTFYNANPPTALQIPECQWNTNYTPSLAWPPVDDTRPVVGVNWCEAYAYCDYVGKRLCGAIGGGESPFGAPADASTSQWYNACSAQGGFDYPYGSAYGAETCNGLDKGEGEPVPVQNQQGLPLTNTTCVGGVPSLYHMSGNVREWEASCDAALGSGDQCRARGGSYLSDAIELMCGAPAAEARDHTAADLGFRCCLGG